jgi:hypothetical protein
MSYSVTYRVVLEGDQQFLSKLNTIAQKTKVGTSEILDDVAGTSAVMMQQNAPVFTGRLKNSIDWEIGSNPMTREIGPQSDGSRFSPDKYGTYVDSGGGPSGMPNVDDIGDRMGLSKRDAFAFAKYLRATGKAYRTPTYFVAKVANKVRSIFMLAVNRLFAEAVA